MFHSILVFIAHLKRVFVFSFQFLIQLFFLGFTQFVILVISFIFVIFLLPSFKSSIYQRRNVTFHTYARSQRFSIPVFSHHFFLYSISKIYKVTLQKRRTQSIASLTMHFRFHTTISTQVLQPIPFNVLSKKNNTFSALFFG